ncbi:hypothetical protein GJAV_G00114200 [Gymnothorax javanicus]|nr:hypothetical protein GJAV_G00114200 [Gymnothorax javanicus]
MPKNRTYPSSAYKYNKQVFPKGVVTHGCLTLLAIRCPFCRWTTCVGPNLSLQEGLWIHTKLWDQISEYENEDMNEEKEEEMRGAKPARQTQLTQESKRPTLECVRPQVKVNPFLKRISSCLQRRFRLSHQN